MTLKELERLEITDWKGKETHRDEEFQIKDTEYYYKYSDIDMRLSVSKDEISIHTENQNILLNHTQAETLFTILKELYNG